MSQLRPNVIDINSRRALFTNETIDHYYEHLMYTNHVPFGSSDGGRRGTMIYPPMNIYPPMDCALGVHALPKWIVVQ